MTVKKKKATNTPKFMGIVVAGASFLEAQSRYRETALSEESVALADDLGNVLATHSACVTGDFFNSMSGELDLVETDRQLQSNSSADTDVEAFVTVCADSCGDVVIADNAKSVKFCPSCSSELPELSDDEVEELIAESSDAGDYPQGNQGVIVSASSFEDAHERYLEVMESGSGVGITDNAPEEMGISQSGSNLSYITHEDCDHQHSPYFGSSSLSQSGEDVVEGDFVSHSNDAGFQAHYLLCQSSDCPEPHIISTKDDSVFCPSCSSAVVDPALLAELQESDSTDDDFDLSEEDDDFDLSEEDDDFDLSEEDDDFDLSEEDDLESESALDDDFDFDVYESSSTEEDMSEEDEDEDMSEEDEDEDEDMSDEDEDLEMSDEDEDEELESESGEDGESDDDDISLELDDSDEDEDEELESESMDLEIDLLQAVSASSGGTLDPDQLHVANCGSVNGVGTWTAFYGGTPVALAKANNVPESVSKIFDKPAFHSAVTTGAKVDGVLATLSSMGFEPIKPDIDLNCVVEHSIVAEAQAKVDAMTSNLQEREADLADRLKSAISISFSGINRNFFKGVSNPLRTKLIGSLSAAGLRNPERIVDSCLAESSDNMAATVISKAMEIASRSKDGQNELAEAISSVNPGVSHEGISDIGSAIEPVESNLPNQSQSLSSESSAPRANPLKRLLNH